MREDIRKKVNHVLFRDCKPKNKRRGALKQLNRLWFLKIPQILTKFQAKKVFHSKSPQTNKRLNNNKSNSQYKSHGKWSIKALLKKISRYKYSFQQSSQNNQRNNLKYSPKLIFRYRLKSLAKDLHQWPWLRD